MNIQGKVWGETREIFSNPNFELHRIEVNKRASSVRNINTYIR